MVSEYGRRRPRRNLPNETKQWMWRKLLQNKSKAKHSEECNFKSTYVEMTITQ